MTTTSINDFRAFSQRLGDNFALVQGAGGNTSLKIDGTLLIKASGTLLKNACTEDIFASVSTASSPLQEQFQSSNDLRPSIETSLHLLLPHKVVAHVHAVDVIALSCLMNAETIFANALSGLRWVFCPYTKPGRALAVDIESRIGPSALGQIDVLVLGNHGLVVGADDCDKAEALIDDVVERVMDLTRQDVMPLASKPLMDIPGFVAANHPWAHSPAFDEDARKIATAGSLYPDHVVFLGRAARTWDGVSGNPPLDESQLVYVPDKGAFLPTGSKITAHDMAGALGMIVSKIPKNQSLRYLSRREENELLNWDAEQFRQNLNPGA